MCHAPEPVATARKSRVTNTPRAPELRPGKRAEQRLQIADDAFEVVRDSGKGRTALVEEDHMDAWVRHPSDPPLLPGGRV